MDDLIYKVFVELAVLEGKRELTGAWLTKDPQDMSRLLRRAYLMVARSTAPDVEIAVAKKK